MVELAFLECLGIREWKNVAIHDVLIGLEISATLAKDFFCRE